MACSPSWVRPIWRPEPGSPLWSHVTDEILTPVARQFAGLNPLSAGLVTALGHSPAQLEALTATGVVAAQ